LTKMFLLFNKLHERGVLLLVKNNLVNENVEDGHRTPSFDLPTCSYSIIWTQLEVYNVNVS